MPATLRSITGKTVDIQIYLGDPETPEKDRDPDDSFTLVFRQHGITGKILDMAADAEEGGQVHRGLCEICAKSFVSWDLRQGASDAQMDELRDAVDAGDDIAIAAIRKEIRQTVAEQTPIPITYEDLMEYVPLDVLVLIMEQIRESRSPNQNGIDKPSRKR